MSKGVPTRLVRDGHIESYDDPPDAPPSRAWARIAAPRAVDGEETTGEARLAHDILSPPLTEPGAFGTTGAERSGRTIIASHEPGETEPPVGIFGTPFLRPSWPVRLGLTVVLLVVALVVIDFTRASSDPGQTTTPTTAPRASLAAASQAVSAGCAATSGLTAEFSQDESAGKPVPSAEGQAKPGTPLKEVEHMIQEANRWPRYSDIVNAATTFIEVYIQAAGGQGLLGWYPVTSDLNALAAQCQLLNIPTS
jgi:hypothetical protein